MPTRWPTSRNWPMSNSDFVQASSRIRKRGSTLCGCSPSVMWARLSSQRTSRSSGNCSRYSVKCSIASREPSGFGVDGGGRDREDAGALAAAHDAVLGLAAAQRGHAPIVDDGVEPVLRGLGRGVGERLGFLQHRVCPLGPGLMQVVRSEIDEPLVAFAGREKGLGEFRIQVRLEPRRPGRPEPRHVVQRRRRRPDFHRR